MPVSFFEGVRDDQLEDINRRNMERRFYALAAAVRDHEAGVRRSDSLLTEADEQLYRRLRQLCGDPATAEHGVA